MPYNKEQLAELVSCKYFFLNNIIQYINEGKTPTKDDFKAWYEQALEQFKLLKQEDILQAMDNALVAFILERRARESDQNAMQRGSNAT
jgi:hypothetical protein